LLFDLLKLIRYLYSVSAGSVYSFTVHLTILHQLRMLLWCDGPNVSMASEEYWYQWPRNVYHWWRNRV